MNTRTVVGLAIGGVFFLFLLILFVIFLVPKDNTHRIASSNTLVENALNGNTMEEKERAAADLASSDSPDALDGLRQVLAQSKDAEVMVIVMQGLGYKWEDVESLGELLKKLENEKVVDDELKARNVRGAAASAIQKIIGQDYGWRVDLQTPEEAEKYDRLVNATKTYIERPPPPRPKKAK